LRPSHNQQRRSEIHAVSANWTASDLAYSGIGSSALTNWAREMAVLVRVKTEEGEPPTFQLSMTKRRLRAGLHDEDAEPTDTIFLRHGQRGGICWEQCEAPVEKPKTTYKVGRPDTLDPGKFRAVLEEFGGSLTRQNEEEVAAKMEKSVRTLWNWWKRLNQNDL